MHTYDGQAARDGAAIKLTAEWLQDPTAEAAGGRLFRLAEERGRHGLVLDLGEVPYLTSMWLSQLVALHQRVRGLGGQLTLVNVPAPVYEVFQVTNLDTLLDLRPEGRGRPPGRR
jgi:anti-anti-sigma factor